MDQWDDLVVELKSRARSWRQNYEEFKVEFSNDDVLDKEEAKSILWDFLWWEDQWLSLILLVEEFKRYPSIRHLFPFTSHNQLRFCRLYEPYHPREALSVGVEKLEEGYYRVSRNLTVPIMEGTFTETVEFMVHAIEEELSPA
jgi:hypothetical protein